MGTFSKLVNYAVTETAEGAIKVFGTAFESVKDISLLIHTDRGSAYISKALINTWPLMAHVIAFAPGISR